MSFDFPSSPATNQEFTPAGGPTYVWNGYGWGLKPTVAVALPGAKVLIQSQTVSAAVASVDFTTGIDATYDEYELHIIGYKPSAEETLGLRISQDGGATWKAGAIDYYYTYGLAYSNAAGFFGGSATTCYVLSGAAVADVATHGIANFICRFFQPYSTTEKKSFFADGTFTNSSVGQVRASTSGTYQPDANAINGIRLISGGGGNIVAGIFNLYGIKK